MWMRWNDSTHIFEQSFNDGASWAVLPLNASVINEGAINIARLPANLAVKDANNNFSVGQTIVGGVGITSGGLTVSGATNITGNTTIVGAVAVTGGGAGLNVTLGAAGTAVIGVQASVAGATTSSRVRIGNDVNIGLLDIACYSSNYAPSGSGFDVPNGTVLYQGGAGGLSFVTGAVGAPMRFFTGTERLRILSTGELCINMITPVPAIPGALNVAFTSLNGIVFYNTVASNCNFLLFVNNGQALAGYINQTGSTTVAYNTSSDARLKIDKGRAINLDSLRSLIVHDFVWKVDKIEDRGFFAQEAHKHFPRAFMPGDDDLTDSGEIRKPWMGDNSKLVPDLVAGWQEHDKRISELEAKLNA